MIDRDNLRKMAALCGGIDRQLTLGLLDELDRAEAKLSKCVEALGEIAENDAAYGRPFAIARKCLAELEAYNETKK